VGEIVLRADLVARDEADAQVRISVQDTGIGIPAHKQARIFDAFDQADSSTSRTYGGTGLGLPISSQLVAMMGGNLYLMSEPGRGTTFAFTLRMPVSHEVHSYQPRTATGTRVLVIDPSATSRQVLADQLANWRFAPTTVVDVAAAELAIEAAGSEGRPFELVVLDDLAPGASAATSQLLATSGHALLSLCVMGGKAAADDIVGRTARVTKPATPSTLLDAIEALLEVGESSPEPRLAPPARVGRPLRVLVADDNTVNRKLASILLERAGHHVTTANDGRVAVTMVARETFDVVLMDMQMPELSGCEATQIIRAQEQATGRHLMIIALTAQAMKGHAEQCIAAGMDGYVSKPLHAPTLFETIERLTASAA
jgi:CheY-like chemotaxis protein